MTMIRTRKRQRGYLKYQISHDNKKCDFCAFNRKDDQFVSATKNFQIVKNMFGYDLWDSCGIKEQLMLVPKKHYISVADFSKAELEEYARHLADFDKRGYSTYTRAPAAITKSIVHQHTHFIKLDNKRKKAVLYLKKPHLLLFR